MLPPVAVPGGASALARPQPRRYPAPWGSGERGRTPRGLALEVTEMQQLDSPEYEMDEKVRRARLSYQELQLVEEWDGEMEGFTAIQLRDQARAAPILDSTCRFVEHLRDFR